MIYKNFTNLMVNNNNYYKLNTTIYLKYLTVSLFQHKFYSCCEKIFLQNHESLGGKAKSNYG